MQLQKALNELARHGGFEDIVDDEDYVRISFDPIGEDFYVTVSEQVLENNGDGVIIFDLPASDWKLRDRYGIQKGFGLESLG